MVIEEYDGSQERLALLGMVSSTAVMGRIAPKWRNDLFMSRWANVVSRLCYEFHRDHGRAIRKNIGPAFLVWAETNHDKETVEMVERFLSGLNDEYLKNGKKLNAEYYVDLSGKFFNRVRLQRLADRIKGSIDSGRIDEAEGHVAAYSRLELGAGAGTDIFTDEAAIRLAFERGDDALFTYPGALGRFFGNRLQRNGFVAFMGPEKVGKSHWLLDVAFRAHKDHRKVAFFEVGDMSLEEAQLRFYSRAAGIPTESNTGKWPYKMAFPVKITPPSSDDECAKVEYEYRNVEKALNSIMADKACKNLMAELKMNKSYFRLSCHSNCSINVAGIRSILESWALQDFIPDVCIIDYADILAPEAGYKKETRDQINETWMKLRALSQDLHCLLVTATQADAEAYDRKTMDRRNFSGNKLKLAHVTGMIGINQTSEEKEKGVQRLNWIVKRKGRYSIRKCVHCATCLDIANPAVLSCW